MRALLSASTTSVVPLPLASSAGATTFCSPAAGLTSTVAPDEPNTAPPTLPTTVFAAAAFACRALTAATSQSRTVLSWPSPFWSPPQPAATPAAVEPDTSTT